MNGARIVTLRSEHRPDGSHLHLHAIHSPDGTLVLVGHDLGPVARPVSDDEEYEYTKTIAAADVPRLVALLGGAASDDVLLLLDQLWSGDSSYELERILRESDIPVELWTWG